MKIKKRTLKRLFLFLLVVFGFFFLPEGTITGYLTFGENQIDYKCPDCNVIILLLDALRADHVGAYGYGRDTTPNIDKLAEEGILFKNMLAQSSWTKPGTASILTGLYPKNHGALWSPPLAEENVLLSEILKENGYSTSAFIANMVAGDVNGFNQGYDNFYDYDDFQKLEKAPYPTADQVNKKLINFIKNLEKTSQQFIYVHYNEPHNPYAPKEKRFSLSTNLNVTEELEELLHQRPASISSDIVRGLIDLYDDEILFNDKMIGEVIDALKEKSMYKNSIIIIISDHGEEFYEHGGFFHGGTLYDEQLLVPWIMQVPKGNPQVMKKQANQIDVVPTILSILGISSLDQFDGINLFSEEEQKFSFAEVSDEDNSIRSSIRTLNDKVMISVNQNPDAINPIVWYKHNESFKIVPGESIVFKVISFLKERQIQIIINDFNRGNVIFGTKLTPFKIIFEENTSVRKNILATVSFNSLSPCTNISYLGVINDSRCLSFGIIPISGVISPHPSREKNKKLLFLNYFYYNLKNDPLEKINLYSEKEYQNMIELLRDNLMEFHKTRRKITFQEPVQYTDEQLETLKALGYI